MDSKIEADKIKLNAYREALRDLPRPEIKSIEVAVIMSQVNGKLAEIERFINNELSKTK